MSSDEVEELVKYAESVNESDHTSLVAAIDRYTESLQLTHVKYNALTPLGAEQIAELLVEYVQHQDTLKQDIQNIAELAALI